MPKVEKALYSDVHAYLAGDLLVKVDLATMGNSLEGRSPFLDHQFMEMTATIPAELKIKNGEKKYILHPNRLKVGDIILRIGGAEIDSPNTLIRIISARKADKSEARDYWRERP